MRVAARIEIRTAVSALSVNTLSTRNHETKCFTRSCLINSVFRNMSQVTIRYNQRSGRIYDPTDTPCLILGLGRNINKLTFDDVKHKIGRKVTEEVSLFT